MIKVKVLANYVDFKVFDAIESFDDYPICKRNIKATYVKIQNRDFSRPRHRLATAMLQLGQSLREFMKNLHSLKSSKLWL